MGVDCGGEGVFSSAGMVVVMVGVSWWWGSGCSGGGVVSSAGRVVVGVWS